MPDSLARHRHASERLVDDAETLLSGATLQIGIGENELVQWRNRHECSCRLSRRKAVANFLDGDCVFCCPGEGPTMENDARRSPGRQVLLFGKINEVPGVAFCRGRIPFEVVQAAGPSERDGDGRRMGDTLSERDRRIARIVGPNGITQQPGIPGSEPATADARIVTAVEKCERAVLNGIVQRYALLSMVPYGGELTEPERCRPHRVVRFEFEGSIVCPLGD